MKKRLILAVALTAISMLLSSCIIISAPEREQPSGRPLEEPSLSAVIPTEEPLPSASPHTSADDELADATDEPADATDEPDVPDETAAAVEESCAYITDLSMRMDGQTDITFDYVDWLTGDKAVEKYLEDHPGATEEVMEAEGLYVIGYIRNKNDKLRTFRTTPDTKYLLPSAGDMSVNVEVGHDEFRDRMFPAVENGVDEYLKFVRVKVQGEAIISIEWLYLP